MTTIVRMDELYVFFDVPENDLIEYQRAAMTSQLPEHTSRKIDVEVRVGREEGFPHIGKIDFRENRVDTSTGTVRIRGRISNPSSPNGGRALYPGLYARVRVPSGPPKPQLAIPEDCIMTGQEGRYVFVVKPDSLVEKRLVTLGPVVWKSPQLVLGEVLPGWALVNPTPAPSENGPPLPARRPVKSMVAISAGLTADDRVIVDGVQKARPTMPVSPDEWILNPPESNK